MTEKKQCPLCGKLINDGEDFCEECQNHMDNQYDTGLLDKNEPVIPHETVIDQSEEPVILEADQTAVFGDAEELVTKRKGLSKGVIFLLVGCALLILVGAIGSLKVIENRESAENEEVYWNECVTENTPVSYAKYLVAFQNGKYAEEATARIKEFREAEIRDWDKLRQSSDINDFYAYLSENPNTPHINQIKFLMDSLSWQTTINDNTADAYKAYLENVKLGNLSGNYVNIAEDNYEYLSQIKMLEGTSLDSVKTEITHLFNTLSENNSRALLKLFASEAYYYRPDSMRTSTAIVALINEDLKEHKIKSIEYTPSKESVLAKRDNKGILFIDLLVNKEITYDIKVKTGKKTEYKKENVTDTLKIELNKNKQIQSITKKDRKTKKATV